MQNENHWFPTASAVLGNPPGGCEGGCMVHQQRLIAPGLIAPKVDIAVIARQVTARGYLQHEMPQQSKAMLRFLNLRPMGNRQGPGQRLAW